MATFTVKSRKIMPIEITTVEAANRDQAIAKTIEAAAEGEEVQIMDAKEGTVEGEEVVPQSRK